MGSVARVKLNADAYLACLTHALSNETEEVMGLCIGQANELRFGCEINICAVMLLRRMDKRKDRVEISVEQLSNASTVAEELAKKTGRPLRIVGWYHSHPHITVWPSHVDVQTQAMYQMMDQTFVGLIFSCFNQTKSNAHSVEMTCFQSRTNQEWDPPQYERIEVPMYVEKTKTLSEVNLQTLIDLPNILVQEEAQAYETVAGSCGDHILTNIHNAAVHAQTICNITETVTSPLLHVFEAAISSHQRKVEQVREENEKLKKEIFLLEKEKEAECTD
ncbi:lys-63-specific deubiquitinase BRCC36-like [Clavelina lepadiformis]|uniref:MPN domain-containing protein n=1 Tax=Clavelina lepadiformis TaxID=159417 RepID=A0ABP0H313_CLALP